ncbi:unnamed protein product [marine sediment metagenome]|uniref:Polysaccharide biosynthesis protein C-terminal domain-containing protein n=1 Tax=marine sediment metagenome TaxID=412755 RepID=X1AQ32_9ZZZZ
MLVAKLYPKEDVGVATALIASMALLVLLLKFGFDQSVIRSFPERDKSKIFSISVVITTFFTVLLGVIFVTGIDICSPKLYIIKNIVFLYPIFLAANSIASLTGTSFVALRKTEHYFLQNLILGLRVIFLFPFIFLGPSFSFPFFLMFF